MSRGGDDHPSLGAVLAYVRWACKASRISGTPAAVAVLVATYYNRRDGFARPSWPELGEVLGRHEDTIYRAVTVVTEAGIWAVEPRPGTASRYRFPLAAAVHTPRVDAGGQADRPPAWARSTPRVGAGYPPRGRGVNYLGTDVEQARPVTFAEGLAIAEAARAADAGEAAG